MLNSNEIYYEFCLEQAHEEQNIFESMVMFDYTNLLEGAEEPLEESVKDITANIKKAIETIIDKFLEFLGKIKKSIDEKINSTLMKQLTELSKKAKEKASSTGESLEFSKEFPDYSKKAEDVQNKMLSNMEILYDSIDIYSAKVAEGKVTEKDLSDLKDRSSIEKLYSKIANDSVKNGKQFSDYFFKNVIANGDRQKVTLTKDDIIEIAESLLNSQVYLIHVDTKKSLDRQIKKMKDVRKKISKIKPEGDNGTLLAQVLSEFRSYISAAIHVASAVTNVVLNADYARINTSKSVLKAYISGGKSKGKDEPTASPNESAIVENDNEIDDDDVEDVDDVEVEEKCKKETCKTVKEMFESEDKEEEKVEESSFDIDDIELI